MKSPWAQVHCIDGCIALESVLTRLFFWLGVKSLVFRVCMSLLWDDQLRQIESASSSSLVTKWRRRLRVALSVCRFLVIPLFSANYPHSQFCWRLLFQSFSGVVSSENKSPVFSADGRSIIIWVLGVGEAFWEFNCFL